MNKPKKKSLGAVLAAAREAHGLSQRQLARLLEVSPSRVNSWESGLDVPNATALVKLAQQLELRASELFELAGVPVPPDMASLPAMLRSEYGLSVEAIAEVQEYVEKLAREHQKKQR